MTVKAGGSGRSQVTDVKEASIEVMLCIFHRFAKQNGIELNSVGGIMCTMHKVMVNNVQFTQVTGK